MKAMENEALHTYANPLSLPEIPFGTDDWLAKQPGMFDGYRKPPENRNPDYRSISDPTVFYWEGKWYLYPSYGMAWVTEDFERWEHVRTTPYNPKYSPSIVPWKDGKFLMASWNNPLYVSDTPLGPFRELGAYILPDGSPFLPCDPGIFADDDHRLYLYAVRCLDDDGPVGLRVDIVGYELDWDNPRQIVRGPVELIRMDPERKPWERHGLYNQDRSFGWCEGPHLLKHNGRYYLIYAAPDTCDASYCMAVYVSDQSPLDGFACQKRNPLTAHRGGVVTGAGHGSVEHGPGGTLWAFYTIAAPYLHRYERRIGMDLVDVDENGELYCPFGVTDTPQYVPGFRKDPAAGNAPGYRNLTAAVRPTASSSKEGREAVYATDENNLSFWQPEKGDLSPTLECDLSGLFDVGAVRIFWRDVGLDAAAGKLPEPIRYLLEGWNNGEWFPLIDRRENTEETNIDYRAFPVRACRKVRLTVTGWNRALGLGVIDFAVFGKFSGEEGQ